MPPKPADQAPAQLTALVDLVARLRSPDGCPWDREQQLEDVRTYLLEEAHELAAAIDEGDWDEIEGELGDLLFQAAFVARLAEEAGAFTAAAAIERAHRKMVARHPHVFGDEELGDAEAVRRAWERRKVSEEGAGGERRALLGGVPASLPPLTAAHRMSQKAAGVGFDWDSPEAVVIKLEEELEELRREMAAADADREALTGELGDVLFAVVNLARKLGVDPDTALARTNRKFRHRFAAVERGLAERGVHLAEASLAEMEALWQAAKGSGGEE